jgi:hypothetical protein
MNHRRLVARTAAVVVPVALVLGSTASAFAAKPIRTPKPTVTSYPAKASNSKAASFGWTTAANTAYTCSLDGSAYTSCVSPKSYSNLTDRSHTFALRAKDTTQSNSKYGTYSYVWTVDTVAPAAPSVSPIAGPTSNTNASVSFSSPDASVAGFTCALDGGTPVACTSPKAYADLTEQLHTVVVTAHDAAGNTSTGSVSWTVDHTAPNIPSVTSPANPTNAVNASIAFSGDGDTYTCKLDAEAAAPCVSPWTRNGLADGSHTLTVTPFDLVPNAGTPASVTWVIDTVAPAAPSLVTGPAAHTQSTDAEVVFADLALDVASHTCTLDGVSAACFSPFDASGLGLGGHTFSVTSSDAAGNTSPALSLGWTVDAVSGPAAFVSGPSSPSNATHPTFDWIATDDLTDAFRCQLDGGAWAPCATGDSVDVTAGTHTFSVQASSDTGTTWSDSVSWTWVTDLTGPVQQPNAGGGVPANSGPVTSTPTFTFTNPDPTTIAGFVCSLDGGPWVPCASGYTPNVGDGAHTLQIATVDQAGNRGGVLSYTWTLDTHAPLGALAFPTTLSGPAKVTFGENVLGVTAATVKLVLAGTTSTVATSQSCLDATAHAVACTGAVRSVVLNHAARFVPGQRYAFVVSSAVHDAAGNPASAPATVFRALRVLQESELAVVQGWAPKTSSAAYGGKYLQSRLPGATATYAFRGTTVTWYSTLGPAMGTAKVYCGTTLKGTVNNYAATSKWRVGRTVKCSSATANNTLRIVATGLKGSKLGKGAYVVVDGVKVGTAAVVTNPVVTQRWGTTASSLASGGRYGQADQANESFQLTFRGTSITWRTLMGRGMGKAKVYVDGVYKGTFDQYASTTKAATRTWKLTDKVHTIKVVATGTQRSGATATRVVLDSLTVG